MDNNTGEYRTESLRELSPKLSVRISAVLRWRRLIPTDSLIGCLILAGSNRITDAQLTV
jgi:hypothetical protein